MKNKAKSVLGPDGRPTYVDGVSPPDRAELLAAYKDDFQRAKDNNKDGASLFVRPWRGYGR